jgi:hypothetical protein
MGGGSQHRAANVKVNQFQKSYCEILIKTKFNITEIKENVF